jgi:hypothetical protein
MRVLGTAPYNRLIVMADYSEIPVMRSLPVRKWDKTTDKWIVPAIAANLAVMRQRGGCIPTVEQRVPPTELDSSFVLKTAPMPQQMGALLAMRDMPAFGLFMDPGTGKTKILIDDAVASHMRGEIRGVLLICPNSIKSNWTEELEKHSGGDYTAFEHSPEKVKLAHKFMSEATGLRWLIMGVESLSTPTGVKVAEAFLRSGKMELAVDESSRIKTHNANRTKAIVKLARSAVRTRIATGTPATQGPQNVWSQFEALDPRILDLDYYPFRAMFCVMGGYKQKQIVASRNEDILLDMISPVVYQARKSECLSHLPPKTYQRRFVKPTPEQEKVYRELVSTGSLTTPNGVMDFDIALVRDLRLHQLTGGFIATQETIQTLASLIRDASPDQLWQALDAAPEKKWYTSHPIPGPNPKIEELKSIVEEQPEGTKMIVWARYRAEVAAIAEALEPYGEAVQFHGGVTIEDRATARQRFQSDPKVRFFVGQVQTGGIGITLTAASVSVFFSSDWSAENRIQAEDRNHRIGSEIHDGCQYIDLLLEGKFIDKRVLNAVQSGVDYHHALMDDLASRLDNQPQGV